MVKDITDFKDIDDLCKLCDNSGEPNIIVKNAEGRFIVMGLADYNGEFEYDPKVYERLKKATEELRSGVPLTDAFEFLNEMRLKYGEKV